MNLEEFNQRVSEVWGKLVKHLVISGAKPDEAEVVVQEAIAEMLEFQVYGEFDPSRGSFETWMKAVVYHRWLNSMRTELRFRKHQAAAAVEPERHPWALLDNLALWQALSKENAFTQRLLEDYLCNGYSIPELSKMYGIPETSLYLMVRKAGKNVYSQMGGGHDSL